VPKREEITGDWRKFLNDVLNNLYSLLNIVRMTKSRRLTWVWQVTHRGKKRNVYKVLVETLKGRDHLTDQDVDGRILLK
jgi:hypothetical protein